MKEFVCNRIYQVSLDRIVHCHRNVILFKVTSKEMNSTNIIMINLNVYRQNITWSINEE